MAFQDQISKLSDEVKSINGNLNSITRIIALNELETLLVHMQRAIDKTISDDKLRQRLIDYINVEHAKARTKVTRDPSPIDIFIAFKQDCIACSDKYNLGAFETKP
jgi:hypothetical protein